MMSPEEEDDAKPNSVREYDSKEVGSQCSRKLWVDPGQHLSPIPKSSTIPRNVREVRGQNSSVPPSFSCRRVKTY